MRYLVFNVYYHDISETIVICSNYLNLSFFIFQFILLILNRSYIDQRIQKIYANAIVVAGINLFIYLVIHIIGHRFVHNFLVIYCIEEMVSHFMYIVSLCYILQLSSYINIGSIILYAFLIAGSSQLMIFAELNLINYRLMLLITSTIYAWICYELYMGDLAKHWLVMRDKTLSQFFVMLRLLFITVFNINPLLRHLEYFFALSIPIYLLNVVHLIEKSLFIGYIVYYCFRITDRWKNRVIKKSNSLTS